jgi:hypothetical protein
MRKLFGMAARRKAPVVLASVLVLAIAGTTFAAARGTVLKMGVSNVLTGNYITAFAATVAGPALQIRNASTLVGSSAIRAWAPYGGTPLELAARAGYPVMRVSNTVKVTNLNSDLVDGYDANGLTRVALNYTSTDLTLTTTATTHVTVAITVPAAGFVSLNADARILQSGCTTGCSAVMWIQRTNGGLYVPFGFIQDLYGHGNSNINASWVLPVDAGTNTVALQLWRLGGDGTITGDQSDISLQYSPFGSSGGNTLGVQKLVGKSPPTDLPKP